MVCHCSLQDCLTLWFDDRVDVVKAKEWMAKVVEDAENEHDIELLAVYRPCEVIQIPLDELDARVEEFRQDVDTEPLRRDHVEGDDARRASALGFEGRAGVCAPDVENRLAREI